MEETKTAFKQTNVMLLVVIFFVVALFIFSATDMGRGYITWLKAGMINFFPSESSISTKVQEKLPNFSYLNQDQLKQNTNTNTNTNANNNKEIAVNPINQEMAPINQETAKKLDAIKKEVDVISVKTQVLTVEVNHFVAIRDIEYRIGQIGLQIDHIGQEINALRTLNSI